MGLSAILQQIAQAAQNPNQGVYNSVMGQGVPGIGGPTGPLTPLQTTLNVQGPGVGNAQPNYDFQGSQGPDMNNPYVPEIQKLLKQLEKNNAELQKAALAASAHQAKVPQQNPNPIRPGANMLAAGIGILGEILTKGKGGGARGYQNFVQGKQNEEAVRVQNELLKHQAEGAALQGGINAQKIGIEGLKEQIEGQSGLADMWQKEFDKALSRELTKQGIVERAFTAIKYPEDVDGIRANLLAQGVTITPQIDSALEKARASAEKRVQASIKQKKGLAMSQLARSLGISVEKVAGLDGKVTEEEATRFNNEASYWEQFYSEPGEPPLVLPRIRAQQTLKGQETDSKIKLNNKRAEVAVQNANTAAKNAETARKRADGYLKNVDSQIGYRKDSLDLQGQRITKDEAKEIGLNLRNDMTTLTQQANSIRISLRQLTKTLTEEQLTPEAAQLVGQDIRNLKNQLGAIQAQYAETAKRKKALDSYKPVGSGSGPAVGDVKEFPQYPGVKYRWDGSGWAKVK